MKKYIISLMLFFAAFNISQAQLTYQQIPLTNLAIQMRNDLPVVSQSFDYYEYHFQKISMITYFYRNGPDLNVSFIHTDSNLFNIFGTTFAGYSHEPSVNLFIDYGNTDIDYSYNVTSNSIIRFANFNEIDGNIFQDNSRFFDWYQSGDTYLGVYNDSSYFLVERNTPVPEPSTYGIFAGIGLLGLMVWKKFKRKQ